MASCEADFLAERRSGIGGSDIHHVLNLEPYGCSRRLWYDKRGDVLPDRPPEATGAMRRGLKLEELIADEYAERSDRAVSTFPMVRHPDCPELIVHVDRVANDPHAGPGILECKTAGRGPFWQMKREGLPEGYICQLQYAMFVTGSPWGSFAVLWPDGWQLIWFDVQADAELQARIKDEALKFWVLVQNGPAPERLPIEAPQCPRCPYLGSCQQVALAPPPGQGTLVDTSLGPLVREFVETRDLREEAKDIHEGVVEQLKAAMGDRLLVEVPGVAKVHYKPQREWDTAALELARPEIAAKFRVKWDLTRLGEAHPELEHRFKRPGTTRPLRVYAHGITRYERG